MLERGVLVYSENRELTLQILGKARELADKLKTKVYALSISSQLNDHDSLIKHGADVVLSIQNEYLTQFAVEPYRAAILSALEKVSPDIILFGATKRGKELAPRIAAALETGCMTECINLDIDKNGRLLGERLTYGGSSIASEVSLKKPYIASIPPRTFEKAQPKERLGEVLNLEVEIPIRRVKRVRVREKKRGDVGLEEAPVIVSAGRGFKEEGDLKLLKELADILGAKIGCSRPIAADNQWLEEWIGISGKKVKPIMYLACGISGTIQHVAGIRDSQIIVSINNNKSANIFQLSDYGVVGDLYKVLPALVKALRNRK